MSVTIQRPPAPYVASYVAQLSSTASVTVGTKFANIYGVAYAFDRGLPANFSAFADITGAFVNVSSSPGVNLVFGLSSPILTVDLVNGSTNVSSGRKVYVTVWGE